LTRRRSGPRMSSSVTCSDGASGLIRPRRPEDLDQCEVMAHRVHHRDGYPVYLPSDLRAFLASPEALTAWVAAEEGQVIGHVALHPRASDGVIELASRILDVPPDRFGVVARLLVAPAARRRGIGSALLRTGTEEARRRARVPILDVVTTHVMGIELY